MSHEAINSHITDKYGGIQCVTICFSIGNRYKIQELSSIFSLALEIADTLR